MMAVSTMQSVPPAREPEAPALAQLDEAARVRMAADVTTAPDALRALAQDEAIMVRASLALNPAAPPQLTQVIAHDPDDRVRALLGQRLAMLLPSLPPPQRDELGAHALAILSLLAADTAIRVRAAIASVVKDMQCVPHALVMQLAQDKAASVSEPIIHFSPLLSDADLLALIAAPSGGHTITAIARRPGLSACIADAIADSHDNRAIISLLENHSAAVHEATLDGLIAKAATQRSWHTPLIRRPVLSAVAASALSEIVSASLLAELAQRSDLPAEITGDLATRLRLALAVDLVAPPGNAMPVEPDGHVLITNEIGPSGRLTEETLIAAGRRGEARLCTALLAHAAHVAPSVVERAAALRSAKGLVSLVWQADFSMRAAGVLQTLLLRLPPDEVLHPAPDGRFPLTPEEMRWQIEFLTRIGRTTERRG